jgi:HEAT repeat protein
MRDIPAAPTMVLFDPNATILKQLTFAQPATRLAYQLGHATHVGDREWALNALAGLATVHDASHAIALQAVREAALSDRFYGVRADAVGAAATFGDASTVAAALRDADVRVRLAAAAAVATPGAASDTAVARLEVMAGSANPDEAAGALQAIGAIKDPRAYALLVAALGRTSLDDAVASGALRGLAAYGDVRALPLLAQRTAYGTAEHERTVAIGAFARLAARTHGVAVALPPLERIASSDPLIASRIAATTALGSLGDPAAKPTLERVFHDDSQTIVRLIAQDALDTLAASAKHTETR